MVNVLLAQKLYLHLVQCAMNERHTWFNEVHDLIHGAQPETCESEVQATNEIINAVATWLRLKNLPRLTVLISSSKNEVSVGHGFWKNVELGYTINQAHHVALFHFFRQECFAYYTAFCGYNMDLQEHVYKRIRDARNDESVNSEEIMLAVSEQVEYFASASTSHDQIHIGSTGDKLVPTSLHKEFFINMANWFERACHENDRGRSVWDMEYLRNAVKKLRREFTLTIPIGGEQDLFALTLARELKEGEMYMATIDEVELLTACSIAVGGSVTIEHTGVQNGRLLTGPEGRRQMCAAATVGGIGLNAVADAEKCTFASHCDLRQFSHVTIRVSFRLG